MRLQCSPTNCGSAGGRPLGSPEIDWYAAERGLGVGDSQVQSPFLSVRFEPEEGAYREP